VNRALVRLVPAAVAVAVIVPAALAVDGAPLEGERLLPDLDQEPPTGLLVTHGRNGWRLGFASAVRNVGAGPLIIDGRRISRVEETMAAEQMIRRSSGPREVVKGVGRLRYTRSPDHEHWHLLHFDRYELRRPGGSRPVVRDRKSGFCLGDRYGVIDPVLDAKPPEPVYRSRCGLERPGLNGVREGISVGYGDDYAANLEGQYLRLDGLRGGRYLLVHRANADRRLLETSFANNASSLLLRLRWRRGTPRIRVLASCPDSARCAAVDGSAVPHRRSRKPIAGAPR
jgi:lysyl oxidase